MHDCAEMCERTPDNPAGNPRLRAANRCSLPDFPRERWDPEADLDASRDAEQRAEHIIGPAAEQGIDLDYDLDRDGCAWGWVQCRYAQSVARYVGTRSTDDPRRQRSLDMEWELLRSPEKPEELIEAVTYAEAWEDGAYARFHSLRNT